MLRRCGIAVAGFLLLTSMGWAQSNRFDVSLGGAAVFSKQSTGNGTVLTPTNSGAVLITGRDGGGQRVGRAARLAADQIARFVRRDREEPRAEAARRIELVGRLMNLEKGFLKDIFGGGAIAEEAHEEVIELALIAQHDPAADGVRRSGSPSPRI